ncbi:MAG TPA: acetate--CoA ligase family protein [Aestuariivirgaceae bacterium]|nr:acetate--CoA ligase family protein [Aestuariivirgaceae bacterium]
MSQPAPLSRLVWPKSLAFIGGTEAEIALVKTRALGYSGRLYAVNPRRPTLGGVACHPSIAELPEAPDAAFISVKREPTIAIVAELARRGSGGAVVYASGFAEVGGDGPELQAELVRAAATMPIMGPNCYGYINFIGRTSLWPDEYGGEPRDRGIAIITQSGNIAINFTMTRRGLPLAAIFTLGNQAAIDIAALLDILADDERITAIGLHIEGLRDPAAFAAAMVKARNHRKPVIALKTGRSEQGARVTMSHTSSLAGSDALYDALFERYGLARVTTITEFVETLKFLHHGGALAGGRCVSMSCSGGEAALVADLALDRELSFPPFAPETAAKVAATLNAYVAIDNPLDYHTFIWGDRDKLTATFAAVLAGGFDVGMLILDTPTGPGINTAGWLLATEAMIDAAARTGARSAVVATLPECLPETVAARLSASGIAPMAGLDDALAAFEAAATIGAAWARPAPPTKLSRPERLGHGGKPLTEYQAKMLLAAAGLDIPEGVIAAPLDAADAARRLGFPVVVKASSATLSHKTEAGGIAVNLTTPEEVRDSAMRMRDLADEVLVEKMVAGAVCELIIGVKTDPQFGLALVIGAGGILTEFLKDAVTLLLPTSRQEIERALGRLRIAALIDGFRGRKGDRAAVIGAIEAVARFAQAHGPYIEELDVNPLMVLPPGQGAVAVDALLRLRTGD